MSHDAAMRILGLKDAKSKNNKGVLVSKRLEDHTEEDILVAFQRESASHSEQTLILYLNLILFLPIILYCYTCFNHNDLPARQGEMQKMQDCHEAYQVTMIMIIMVVKTGAVKNYLVDFVC